MVKFLISFYFYIFDSQVLNFLPGSSVIPRSVAQGEHILTRQALRWLTTRAAAPIYRDRSIGTCWVGSCTAPSVRGLNGMGK